MKQTSTLKSKYLNWKNIIELSTSCGLKTLFDRGSGNNNIHLVSYFVPLYHIIIFSHQSTCIFNQIPPVLNWQWSLNPGELQQPWKVKVVCKSCEQTKKLQIGFDHEVARVWHSGKGLIQTLNFYINSTAKNTFFSESVCMHTNIYMFLTVYLFVT